MKHALKTLLIAAALVLPVSTWAGHHEQDEGNMNPMQMCKPEQECPMADNMKGMQNKMGGMMSDMHGIMKQTKDPVMKEKMGKMHGDMGGMMQHMKQMHEQMMGGKGVAH